MVGDGEARRHLKAADASSLRKLDRLLQRGSDEGYEVFQIGGSDPVTVAAATRLVLPYGYDELNLNCGCPAITSGAATTAPVSCVAAATTPRVS